MAGSVFDSPLLNRLFAPGDVGKLFTDSAEVRALMLVEGALARVQGRLGVIPEISSAAIHRAAQELLIDPGALAQATGQNGVCIPGLVAAFRSAMEAPEHAQYLHWGATSQDIIDTALMLRMKQVLAHLEAALRTTIRQLGGLAVSHADLPMAGRTWGQHATVHSFGAVVAGWGAPLLALLEEMPDLRARCLWVSLAGAAGTASALGPRAGETRAALADELGLHDPQRSWHTDRGPVLALAGWMTRLSVALGKMAEDLTLLSQSDLGEVRLGASGGSSTMPQKQNPVQPGAMLALARHVIGLNGTLQGAGLHALQRDGAAWFSEWLTLPQLCLSTAAALQHAQGLSATLAPDATAMAQTLAGGQGLIHAEALSFRLAAHMPRPEAQAAVKALCKAAGESGAALADLTAKAHPGVALGDIFDPARQMGSAPAEARAFGAAALRV